MSRARGFDAAAERRHGLVAHPAMLFVVPASAVGELVDGLLGLQGAQGGCPLEVRRQAGFVEGGLMFRAEFGEILR